jgi:hypothetical protein
MATIGLKRFHLASLLALIIITLLLAAAYWFAGRDWISQWHSDRQLDHALQRSEAVQQPLREFI